MSLQNNEILVVNIVRAKNLTYTARNKPKDQETGLEQNSISQDLQHENGIHGLQQGTGYRKK
jgi:hypothetical protein